MSFFKAVKNVIIGQAKDPQDKHVFQHLSLIAVLAWVGLGADGLSSSCYGPEEAFLALHGHPYLGIFVAILTALTVFVVSASYSQIIELFPSGGGGYLVASKLINPTVGMVSGCALLIDYVLTIAISIVSGMAALFSFFPADWQVYLVPCSLVGVFLLMLMNMRGVKETVVPLTPVFMIFVLTHIFVIVYALLTHVGQVPQMMHAGLGDVRAVTADVGWFGLLFLILRAYSLGAGTFTGIEAVSNGLPILREPRVVTGKKTMQYMAVSLAVTVAGLMIAYLLFNVQHVEGKTLNAVLLENMTVSWGPWGHVFLLVTLVSEAMLLFVAAQAGFLDGPRVLSNMAIDRWAPTRFSSLSDRLVTQNGVILMGSAALLTVFLTKGSLHLLVVLYSINVFITFCLSQAGMVRHWWDVRRGDRQWLKKLGVNGIGFIMTAFILITMVALKFNEGGWVTLLITAALVVVAIMIRAHYRHTLHLLKRLNILVETVASTIGQNSGVPGKLDRNAQTAVILVNGFNGLGLHTLMGVIRSFGIGFKNFVFLQVGVVDAGNFKGVEAVEALQASVRKDLEKYVEFMHSHGYYAEAVSCFGTDVVEEVEKVSDTLMKRLPGVVYFGGQLVFPRENIATRWLHNYTVFAIQRRLYHKGRSFVILPIRVDR
ncbi:MAG: APC family permease [Candidatus Omnitrophica bacterium]|nr:APC family permease [Candidatus Omnitrophota bacterium]